MTDPVVRAVEFAPTVNQNLVDYLDASLEQAKRGEIVSGLFVGLQPVGSMRFWSSGYSHGPGATFQALMGALELVKHRLIACHTAENS